MNSLRTLTLFVCLATTTAQAQDAGLANLIKSGAGLEKLAGDFEFTEGPTPDRKGNVYFTDQPADRIMVWNTKTGLGLFMQPSGRSNGMAFDSKGNLWTCADNRNEI